MHTSIRKYNDIHVSQAQVGKMTVLDGLDEQMLHNPDMPFVTEVAKEGGESSVTYREFEDLSRRAMTWLTRECNLTNREILGFAPHNDIKSLAILFGAIRLGVVIVFLNPSDPVSRRETICASVKAKMLSQAIPSLNLFPTYILPDPLLDPADDVFFFATSGSTATSKIVAQTHRGVVANALAMKKHHLLKSGDRFLSCLPIYHVNGFHFSIIATTFSGSHTILVQGFDPFRYPALINEFRPKVVSLVPSIVQALLMMWKKNNFPDELKYFVSAAAPLSQQAVKACWAYWKIRILQGYGLTETINFSTMLPCSMSEKTYSEQALNAKIPSIGIAIEGNEVGILSVTGQILKDSQVGEICIRGHNVMDRYVGNEKETAISFKDGWFHTGDVGFVKIDPDSRLSFFTVTGRMKNIAKVNGNLVSLDEIERRLLEVDGVKDIACTTLSDELVGDNIIVILVADTDVTDSYLFKYLRTYFSQSVMPKRIVRCHSIPRSVTGKIQRTLLNQYIK